jgi:NTE family protein
VRALVLGGGGAKGAWQAAVVNELYGLGWTWDCVVGTSVGALNAAVIGQRRSVYLLPMWGRITRDDVISRSALPLSLWRMFKPWGERQLGLYQTTPLRELLEELLAGQPWEIPTVVGATDLRTGTYVSVDLRDTAPDAALDWLVASGSIPVAFEPALVSGRVMVDGGVRNNNPISQAIGHIPDHIVVIPCSRRRPSIEAPPDSVLDVAGRSIELMLNEIFQSDIDGLLRLNKVMGTVGAAIAEQKLLTPPDRETLRILEAIPYSHYDVTIIEPSEELGGALDFSEDAQLRRIDLGVHDARRAWEAYHNGGD